jgi:hypothetical protein
MISTDSKPGTPSATVVVVAVVVVVAAAVDVGGDVVDAAAVVEGAPEASLQAAATRTRARTSRRVAPP